MKRQMLGAVCLMVVCGAAKLSAQAHADRPNRALEQLRSGVWLERGGFDSFEPEGAAPAGPVGAAVPQEKHRLVAVGWEMSQLSPPTLDTGVRLEPPGRTPVPVEARPVEAARPTEAARAVAAVPSYGLSPCQDIRRKASSLRAAASQCDTDIANGRPFCNVSVSFESPRIPRSLTAQGAREYAAQFEAVVNGGSERACADYGGIGSMPEPPVRPLVERLRDSMNSMANEQVNQALLQYALGGFLSKITYGPNAPWTRALMNHSHLDGVRRAIREEYQRDSSDRAESHSAPFTLDNLSLTDNLRYLLRDLVAPLIGANMAYTTGSINFRWKQRGYVDRGLRRVTVDFTATDRLRIGSSTRVGKWEMLPDDMLGTTGPMHTVGLEWQWTEVISY